MFNSSAEGPHWKENKVYTVATIVTAVEYDNGTSINETSIGLMKVRPRSLFMR